MKVTIELDPSEAQVLASIAQRDDLTLQDAALREVREGIRAYIKCKTNLEAFSRFKAALDDEGRQALDDFIGRLPWTQ